MKNPDARGAGADLKVGNLDRHDTARQTNSQAACRAIEAGLASIAESDLPDFLRAEINVRDLSVVIRRRLTERQCLYGAIAFTWSLQISTAEELAEAALHDLRAGPPVPPFMSIREAAMSWAAFASRAEGCHYLAAIWDRLPDDDRQRFLGRAI